MTRARGRRRVVAALLATSGLLLLPGAAPAAKRVAAVKRAAITSVSQAGGRLGWTARPQRGRRCGDARRFAVSCPGVAHLKAPGARLRRVTRRPAGGQVPGYVGVHVGSGFTLLDAESLCLEESDEECISEQFDKVLVDNGTLRATNVGGRLQTALGVGTPQTLVTGINGRFLSAVDVCNDYGGQVGCEAGSPPAYHVRFAPVPDPAVFGAGIVDIGVRCQWTALDDGTQSVVAAVSDSGDGAFIVSGRPARLVRAAAGACGTVAQGADLGEVAYAGKALVYTAGVDVHLVDTASGANRVAGRIPALDLAAPRRSYGVDSRFALGGSPADPVIAWHESRFLARRRIGERDRVMRLADGRVATLATAVRRRGLPDDALTAPSLDGPTAVWGRNGERRSAVLRARLPF